MRSIVAGASSAGTSRKISRPIAGLRPEAAADQDVIALDRIVILARCTLQASRPISLMPCCAQE